MAQTIQIKRSTGTAVPSSLSAGELAYSFKADTKKLYIGDGSNVITVGGQAFTDKLDGIAAGANNYTLPLATDTVRGGVELFSDTDQSEAANSVTTTAGKTYGIQLNSSDQMVVNVPWTDSSGDNKLPLTGGTLTGSLLGTNASFSSAPDTNNTSITIGYNSGVGEIKVKNNNSSGAHLDFFTTNSSGTTAVKLRILDAGGLSISTGNVTMNGTLIGVSALGMGGAITGATSVQTDSIIEKTAANGVSIDGITVKDGGITLAGDLSFGDSNKAKFGAGGDLEISHSGTLSTIEDKGTGNLQLVTNGTSIDFRGGAGNNNMAKMISNGAVELHHSGSSKFSTTASGIDVTGEVKGDSLDIDGNADISGALVVQGDLTVNGTTTTVDSTTVVFGDNILRLNKDYTGGTPTADAGLEVERGTVVNAYLVWDESADRWSVATGTVGNPDTIDQSTMSPINVENIAINGGSF